MREYEGGSLDEVPAAGQTVTVDFRYGSSEVTTQSSNTNQLPTLADSEIVRQLVAAGPHFMAAIPEEQRGALYTVDGIADHEDRVWFLEANCHPLIHPDAYLGMFEGLFGPATAAAAGPERRRARASAGGVRGHTPLLPFAPFVLPKTVDAAPVGAEKKLRGLC
jgi:hypothetical protein